MNGMTVVFQYLKYYRPKEYHLVKSWTTRLNTPYPHHLSVHFFPIHPPVNFNLPSDWCCANGSSVARYGHGSRWASAQRHHRVLRLVGALFSLFQLLLEATRFAYANARHLFLKRVWRDEYRGNKVIFIRLSSVVFFSCKRQTLATLLFAQEENG